MTMAHAAQASVQSSADQLIAIGHLGWDAIDRGGAVERSVGGSLFHFLNGLAFTCVPCTALTWTTPDVTEQALTALPPWISVESTSVPHAPVFEISYHGETLTNFDISNIEMPSSLTERLAPFDDMHLCAMPLEDALRILRTTRPKRWSIQFHTAVLPRVTDLERLSSPPDVAFCTTREFGRLYPVVSAFPTATWIVTERDRVRAVRAGDTVAEFTFSPLDSPVDTTGAGDLLAGAIIGCIRRGVPLELALRLGTGVAATSLSDYSTRIFANWWQTAKKTRT